MNERIDEFAFEAGCNRHKYWDPTHPDLEGFIISQAALDKFAELIIRECCFTGEQYAEGLIDPCHYAFINKKIKEHFGVEG